jgi:predicted Zn-dependent protease with MMP-like domain
MRVLSILFCLLAIIIAGQGCRNGPILGEPANATLPQVFHPLFRNVYIPDDFSKEQIQDIEEGLHEWERKTSGSVSFNIIEHYDKRIVPSLTIRRSVIVILDIPADAPMVLQLDERESKRAGQKRNVLGFYNENDPLPTVNIVSSRVMTKELFISVFLHEIGHSLGLDHNPMRGTLMYPDQELSAKHIMPEDLSSFCQLHPCVRTE